MSYYRRLLDSADAAYLAGDKKTVIALYVRMIEECLQDGYIAQRNLPVQLFHDPCDNFAGIWRNFAGFFVSADIMMRPDPEEFPQAFDLLNHFGRRKSWQLPQHWSFSRCGTRGILLLRAIQASAASTLGMMAMQAYDRPTAAKRFYSIYELVDKFPTFQCYLDSSECPSTAVGSVEVWAWRTVRATQTEYLGMVTFDHLAAMGLGEQSLGPGRKEWRRMHDDFLISGSLASCGVQQTFSSRYSALRPRIRRRLTLLHPHPTALSTWLNRLIMLMAAYRQPSAIVHPQYLSRESGFDASAAAKVVIHGAPSSN
ncbi:hypothetical protein EXIGLDRAFT_701467 [Exidia glandulosa HHB12029]|uniref:Uncharacterized protein n=1 Tax=Exidia glandulosa HHB12029 TaxID=1314781 RepID=A0A165ZK64_EXIGL|nr:hypothetical protein EXIGLDRAFT_701467 [Exidia glandulosa HHB12029]